MSLSERDLKVLAELEHDLGRPSAGTRLYLLIVAGVSAISYAACAAAIAWPAPHRARKRLP